MIDWKKYVIVLFITVGLFGLATYASSFLDQKRLSELKTVQDKISLDILSSETEFSILEELSCKDASTSLMTPRLNELESKIQYSEQNIGINNPEVITLKRYYTILQIKDYLLMKRISDRCKLNSTFVLYVYDPNICVDCEKQGLVLNSLRTKYPNLQIYSFDNTVESSAMKALILTYKVPNEFPSFVINGKVYSGFKTMEDIEKLIPNVVKQRADELKLQAEEEVTTNKKTIKKDETTNQ